MLLRNIFILILYIPGKGTCKEVNLTSLINNLFSNYHKDIRPTCDTTEPVRVALGMALRQVIDLNEPRQILEINSWIRMRWNDCYLRWNATEYDGIDHLIVPYSKIWVPDITLYDNAGNQLEGLKDYRPAISSTGDIAYNFPTVITSLCKVDVTYFPFDTQECKLKFGSWAYHGLEVDVVNRSDSGDIGSFVQNVEWSVSSVPVKRTVSYYGCCPEPYPDVTFFIIIDRKPLFYMLNLLFPCMLISTVACLGFLLPPDSGEKVSLEITVLLSLAVFLLVVSETMPPSSETFPFIGIYFACAMLLVSLSCLMTVIVLNLHFKGNHGKEMPAWVRNIFLDVIGKLVCVKIRSKRQASVCPTTPRTIKNDIHEFSFDVHETTIGNGSFGRRSINELQKDQNCILESPFPENGRNVNSEVDSVLSTSELMLTLRKQLDTLRGIEKFIIERKRLEEIIEEWQLLAQVLDRVFLIIFIAISFISTLSILLRSSHN